MNSRLIGFGRYAGIVGCYNGFLTYGLKHGTYSLKPAHACHDRKEVEEALQPLRSAALNLMSEKWQRGTTIEVIYLAGGGAELVMEDVLSAYPQTKLIKQAQLANARGYLNYAHFATEHRD